MVELRVHEQKILSALEKLGQKASVEQLIEACGFPDAAIMRSALVLQEEGLVEVHAEHKNIVKLTVEGEQYAKNGLPERNLIKSVALLGGSSDLQKAAKEAGLSPQFIQIALGWTLRKKWAVFLSDSNTIRIAEAFLHQAFIPEGTDEKLLSYLCDKSQASLDDLSKELQEAAETLKKRKLLTVDPKTRRILQITSEGKKAVTESKIAIQEVTQLTPELIISGKWRGDKASKIQHSSASSEDLGWEKASVLELFR